MDGIGGGGGSIRRDGLCQPGFHLVDFSWNVFDMDCLVHIDDAKSSQIFILLLSLKT